MPSPHKNEKKDDYIARCMSDPEMKSKFDDNKQRVAVCFSYWDKKNESAELTFKQFLMENS